MEKTKHIHINTIDQSLKSSIPTSASINNTQNALKTLSQENTKELTKTLKNYIKMQ